MLSPLAAINQLQYTSRPLVAFYILLKFVNINILEKKTYKAWACLTANSYIGVNMWLICYFMQQVFASLHQSDCVYIVRNNFFLLFFLYNILSFQPL